MTSSSVNGDKRFETDDTVILMGSSKGCTVDKNKIVWRKPETNFKYGLITETYSDNEDDDSDDEDDEDDDGSNDKSKSRKDKLREGFVRIEWFPSGREEMVSVDKVSLWPFVAVENICNTELIVYCNFVHFADSDRTISIFSAFSC